MSLRINLHESRQNESNIKFLPDSFKELEYELPSCYDAKALAIFKASEEVDPDAAWYAEDMSWDAKSATVEGNYLMVAMDSNEDTAKSVMEQEYKTLMLSEAPELVAYLDVESIRKVFATQIVDATKGKSWELGYYLGDINDMQDVPGCIDNAYTDYGEVSCMVGAFGFAVAEAVNGSEIKDTQSADEALKFVEEMYNKYQGDTQHADED